MKLDSTSPTQTLRRNIALYLAVLLLTFAAVLGGVFAVWPAVSGGDDANAIHQASEPGDEDVSAAIYRDVLSAARSEALAFVNLDYRKIDESVEAVSAGATGAFAEQYQASEEGLRTLMKRNRSIMEGEVLSVGVVAITEYTARVLVATNGSVSNKSTKAKKVERNLRLQLELTKADGKWLVNDLQFVG